MLYFVQVQPFQESFKGRFAPAFFLARHYSILGLRFSLISLVTSVAGIRRLLEILQLEMRPSYAQPRAVQIETPNRAAKSLIGRRSGSITLFSLFTITGIFPNPPSTLMLG
jgi:hypothetical protein